MAFISAIGICSVAGISYGPVHTSLPFLLLGLGVDDIFVMMACWRQVESMETIRNHKKSIPERIALMLRHAGASITVTSLTDVVAFLVGAFTVSFLLQKKVFAKNRKINDLSEYRFLESGSTFLTR